MLFADHAALDPLRYGEPAMPRSERPQAPLPGHDPAEPEPTAALGRPPIPSAPVPDNAPNQYADGPPFSTVDMRRPEAPLPVGRLLDAASQNARPVTIDAMVADDPHVAAFVVLQGDVWEEFTPAGTTTPSYSLKFSKGQRVPRAALDGLRVRTSDPTWPPPVQVK